jgi:transporter family-2 protein
MICTYAYLGCNATLNRYGGRAFSSVVSFSVGVVCCLIFFAIDVTVGNTPLPNDHLKSKKKKKKKKNKTFQLNLH